MIEVTADKIEQVYWYTEEHVTMDDISDILRVLEITVVPNHD